MEKQNILLVDDDADLLKVMSEVITTLGYGAILASNGQEAVLQFEKHIPNLVFMDVKMPILDGFDAFFRIRSKFPNANIIMMTGFADHARWKEVKSSLRHLFIRKTMAY
ncbi:response regulator [Candidatus Nitrosotenuis chungbukensis]|uniref:response regulator n=1 Tax=Candidatus Nitrosotenuis chungbukensis TaxID=1353246 RepID=UPI00267193C4|nr:response regulator [Candidatus Nitrosotenuis chungbukensis]WKT57718.1 response regulator [Candidatus Nitrosotenuis chungbukensis]